MNGTDDAVQNLRLDTLESTVQSLVDGQTTMKEAITELMTQSRAVQALVKALGAVILGGLGLGGAAVGLG